LIINVLFEKGNHFGYCEGALYFR